MKRAALLSALLLAGCDENSTAACYMFQPREDITAYQLALIERYTGGPLNAKIMVEPSAKHIAEWHLVQQHFRPCP